ncbi:M48 family metallopeptidase [Dyadobacter bucti]|uniref:M48 family metallopeptidase n=2 Tax=Dyadobacter bucti TaxID=2572203 RepID=UPI0011092D8C|nr:M48 family metallopeptidase [Dyadobacter bucti]
MFDLNIKYYDGKVSVAHDATMILMSDHWLIKYSIGEGINQYVRWDIKGIMTDENFTTIHVFRYGGFPEQTVVSKDGRLPQALKDKYPSKRFIVGRSSDILKKNTVLASLTVAVVVFIAVLYWYIIPLFAEKAASQIPTGMEVSIGSSVYETVMSQYEVNDTLTGKVNDFLQSFHLKTSYPIEVTVVNDKQCNAFALPGGHIIIFSGIIAKMKTKEELAALLAHETAHIHYRHSLKSTFRTLSRNLFVSLLFNDINGVAAIIADNSNMLMNLTYSRELEIEADKNGMAVLAANGISLRGFTDLFQLLNNHAENSGELEILSTHPLTTDRIAYAKESAREQVNIRDQSSLENKWLNLRLKAGN